jgi:transcription initiation factor TFIID TATA-box-binding protein
MADINIENMVTVTQIADKLDVEKLAKKIPDSNYNPEEFNGIILRFKEPKTAVLIFTNGKVICTGSKNIDDANKTITSLVAKMKEQNISIKKQYEVTIQNIVASSDFNKDLKLGLLAQALISENIEYDPEQFPGLIYRMNDSEIVILLFSSGKIVCTGAQNIEDIKNGINFFRDKLTSLGAL